jgi:hypothetical protein
MVNPIVKKSEARKGLNQKAPRMSGGFLNLERNSVYSTTTLTCSEPLAPVSSSM